ncbi:MAG: type VI secretion system baseplate subunit TssG [Acidobacteriota bacterium]
MDPLSPPSVILPSRTPASASPQDLAALQALWEALAQSPYAHDLFQTLRRIQASNPASPRLGEALRPKDEAVRVGQAPELNFAPSAIHAVDRSGAVPRLIQRPFGLFGPMGPLPLHLTEYVRERAHHHGDPTWARFADVFHHRAALLFFRAWAQSRPVVHRDRPWDDDFARWVSSLIGQGTRAFSGRDAVSDDAKRFHAAALAKGPRTAEALAKLLQQHFGVPVRIQPYVGHWLPLQPEDRTRLQPSTAPHRNSALGQSAVLGRWVWDRQSHFRVVLGPLSWDQYQHFMPGQRARVALRDWLRQYVGLSLSHEVSLVLRGDQVPRLQLQRPTRLAGGRAPAAPGRLGLSSWLGSRQPFRDQAALRLRLEPSHSGG